MRIDHPEKIFNLLEKGKTLNDKLNLFTCKVDNTPAPDNIDLKLLANSNFHFPCRKLVRLQDKEKTEQLKECLENGSYKIINKFPETEYFFQIATPSAITKEYIFFKKESKSEDGEKEHYRISKTLNNGLDSICINDPIGILELNDRKYMAFDPLLLYLDVTDDECCAKNGIEIVNEILI